MKIIQIILNKVRENWFFLFIILILAFSSELFLDPTQPIKFILLVFLCLVGNLWFLKTKIAFRFSKTIVVFLGIYLLYILINLVSLFFYEYSFTGIYESLKLCMYLNLIVLIIPIIETEREKKLQKLSVSISIFQLISVSSILISLINDFHTFQLFKNKIYGGISINPNLNSQLLLLSIPLVLIGLKKNKYKWLYVSQCIGISLSVLALIILNSKTVLATSFIVLLLFIGMFSYVKTSFSKRLVLSFSLISIILISLFVWQNKEKLTNLHSIKHRSELWHRTIHLIKENPFKGAGIGMWKIDNLNYVPTKKIKNGEYDDIPGIYTPQGSIFYIRPHNDFLWVFSELGLIGFLSYLSLFGYLGFVGINSIRNNKHKTPYIQIILFLSLIAYLLIAQTSFPKERIEQSIILVLISSLILTSQKDSKSILLNSKIIYFLIPITLIVLIIGTIRAKSDFYMKEVKQNRFNKQWQSMLYNINKIDKNFYPIVSDGQPVNLYKGIAELNLGNVDFAYRSLLKAKEQNPNQLMVLSNLGTYHYMKKRNDSAMIYFDKALKLNPNFEDAILNKVAIYFNENKIDAAWAQIKDISILSNNTNYRNSLTVLLKKKFEEKLILDAHKKFQKEKVDRYIKVYKYNLFYNYRASQINKTSLEFEFNKSLNRFK